MAEGSREDRVKVFYLSSVLLPPLHQESPHHLEQLSEDQEDSVVGRRQVVVLICPFLQAIPTAPATLVAEYVKSGERFA